MASCDYIIAQDGEYRVIRLDHKHLKEYPKEIKLNDLDGIVLSNNLLVKFPEISIIENLRAVYISANQITTLPQDIGRLKNLEKLILGFNQLKNLPDELGYLNKLKYLSLPANQLTQLPSTFGNLKNLEVLDLNFNQFRYFPDVILKIKSLKELYLTRNFLSKLPKHIHRLTNLESLNLMWMNCKVSIPPEIEKLKKLENFAIDKNSKTIPTTTQKGQPLSLFEICTDYVLRNKLIKQDSHLPQDVVDKLNKIKETCHHCDGSFLKKLSITVIRDVVIKYKTINTQAYFCSEKCRQAWKQTTNI